MPFINCEITLILTWSTSCVIVSTNAANLVTLSLKDNEKLLEQLQSGFKRVINWNKYLPKPELLAQNPFSNYLIEPNFQGLNSLFVLAFENDT